ncbi:hypothetical protein [Gluconobacter sp. OJB]|uniref:hypothetical protein n=1 Tax=Gluconobacter sp. OJB TaxID=3145196 RepID=UPI0031F7D088
MRRILMFLCLLFLSRNSSHADTHAIANWGIHNPTFSGTASGDFSFSGTVLFPNPASGNNSQQAATTYWVNQAIASSGGANSGSYCSTSGCTLSANGGAVPLNPFNFQGYNALGIGNTMFIFSSGTGIDIGFGYTDDGNGVNPGFLLKYASLNIDRRLRVNIQETPASSSASCQAGTLLFDASYEYYCISSGKWGRIPWQTGW